MTSRILVVDDDRNALMAVKRALMDEAWQVEIAQSAADAFKHLALRSMDLIISDHEMPTMNGVDFLFKVAEIYPGTIRIMLTGHATVNVAIEAINRGAIHKFLVKPCSPPTLIQAIKSALVLKGIFQEGWEQYQKLKQNKELVAELEKNYPGLTRVEVDEEGSIIIDDASLLGNDELLADIEILSEKMQKNN